MGHSRWGAGQFVALMLATTLASAAATARPRADEPTYKDPSAPVEQRVEDLLSRMTLDEKIAQITCSGIASRKS